MLDEKTREELVEAARSVEFGPCPECGEGIGKRGILSKVVWPCGTRQYSGGIFKSEMCSAVVTVRLTRRHYQDVKSLVAEGQEMYRLTARQLKRLGIEDDGKRSTPKLLEQCFEALELQRGEARLALSDSRSYAKALSEEVESLMRERDRLRERLSKAGPVEGG